MSALLQLLIQMMFGRWLSVTRIILSTSMSNFRRHTSNEANNREIKVDTSLHFV